MIAECSSAGDLGLMEKVAAIDRVIGLWVAELLECHLAAQLVIESYEDTGHAGSNMRAEDAKPLTTVRGRANGAMSSMVDIAVAAQAMH